MNIFSLRTADGAAEAFSEGSEGWGIADGITRTGGGLTAAGAEPFVPTLESFSSTATRATSVVRVAGTFRVTHDFHPAAQSPALYEVVVTVENTSAAPTDVHYRRMINWYPAAAGAPWGPPYVARGVGSQQPQVEHVASEHCDDDPRPPEAQVPHDTAAVGENAFCHPQSGDFQLTAFVDASGQTGGINVSPVYDFALGPLAPGAKLQFRLYYGVAGSEPAVLAALAAAGVNTYTTARRADGAATFAFGYGGVTNHLIVLRDSGVVGTPMTQGDTTVAGGTSVPYNFSLAQGFQNLTVWLDGRQVPTTGTIPMDSGRVLIVSADRIPTVPNDAGPLAQALRAVLTAGDPVGPYQAFLDLAVQYAAAHSGDDLTDRLEQMEFATIDPIADAAALRRVDQALGGHEFPINLGGPTIAALNRGRMTAARSNRQTRPRVGPRADVMSGGSGTEPTTVRYVNGIFNGDGSSAASAGILGQLVLQVPELARGVATSTRDVRVVHFYNRTFVTQVPEQCLRALSARHRFLGTAGRAIFFTSCVQQIPIQYLWQFDLTESLRQLIDAENWGGLRGSSALQSPDAQPLADSITSDRAQGRHVILVPHSQGNLLSQQSLNLLSQARLYMPAVDSSCIGVVSLAAPTNDGWLYTPSDQIAFVAVKGDVVTQIHNSTPPIPNAVTDSMNVELAVLDVLAKVQVSLGGQQVIQALKLARRAMWGVETHNVQASYMQAPETRPVVVNALGSVYHGCAVDHVTAGPPAISDASSGYTHPLAFWLWNGFGRQLPFRPLSWSSSNVGVATVDTLGVVTTIGPGSAIVTGTTSGGRSVAVPVTVGTATGN